MSLHGIHGKLNCCGCQEPDLRGPLLIWMIIDEDTAAYAGFTNQGYCGCYEEQDTAPLLELYRQYPFLNGVTVCKQVEPNPQTVATVGHEWRVFGHPPGVVMENWDRPPTFDRIKNDFLADIGRFKDHKGTIHFYVQIDNSGSMTTATIQPAWNQFVSWLDNEYKQQDDRFEHVRSNQTGFPERWINFIQSSMRDYTSRTGAEPVTASFALTTSEIDSITEGFVGS